MTLTRNSKTPKFLFFFPFPTLPGTKQSIAKGGRGITVSSEKIAGEEVIDDASPSSNGYIHVISLFTEPVEIVPPLQVLGFPRRLLGEPLGALWLTTAVVFTIIVLLGKRRFGTSEGEERERGFVGEREWREMEWTSWFEGR